MMLRPPSTPNHGSRRDPIDPPSPRGRLSVFCRPVAIAGLAIVALAAGLPGAARAQGSAAAVDPAPSAVRYRDHVSWLRVNPLFVLPGERVTLEARSTSPAELRATGGRSERLGPRRWAWTAPQEAGDHRLALVPETAAGADGAGDDAAGVTFNVFVMVPRSEVRDGVLNGYRIGRYPESAFRGLARYRPPEGFVEVTPENRDVRVSPHFRLGDFLCKQPAGWPRYVVLEERLLWKLEAVIAALHRREGASSLHVMSGYRTPHYNAAIGQARHSRHMYGDAADVFVDEKPEDGHMDDLNGDGRETRADARRLYRIADRVASTSLVDRLIGGMGYYPATPTHGPFVHIDARGYRARW